MRARTLNRPVPAHRLEGGCDLNSAMAALGEAVADNPLLRERLDSLRERLEHRRFQLAVLGQFKRGKSSFINALLGAPLLPIAVVPLTAVPVFISWRSPPLVRVRFLDRRPDEKFSTDDDNKAIRDFLFRFVSEEANPKNHLGVDRVDLFYPATILANGIELIDTPGVGSTLRHNTEAAHRVLPESDAAFFVISVDPPITEVEIEYLQRIKAKAARLFFILNKIDYLRAEERHSVVQFVRHTLEQNDLWSSDAAIFSVSASEGLDAKQRGDRAGLESSGIATIEHYLSDDLAAQKGALLNQAACIKAIDIISEAAAEVRLQTRALEMPLEELAAKCHAFEQTLVSIEAQRRIIRDLLGGERRRLREQVEERTKALRNTAKSKLTEIVGAQARQEGNMPALSQAISEIFDAARQEFSASFAAIVDTTLNDHQRRIGALIDDIRRTADELFNTPFQAGFEPDSFSLGEDPYWLTEKIQTTLLPQPSRLVDRIVPYHARVRRRIARVLWQVDELILRNAENLRWAILRGIDETFGKASFRFEQRLDNAIATTNGIVHEALDRRRTSGVAAGDALDRLQEKSDLLSDLRRRFRSEVRDFEDSKPMTDQNMQPGTVRHEYRPGVGIVLLNARGEVFVGRRADLKDDVWQMPQGGIDDDESPREAALRELKEEIGTDKADVIAESRGWFTYDVPPVPTSERWGRGRWKGQRQKWVVMLFRGNDTDINLTTDHPEFDAWRWVPVKDLPELAAPFKRQLYLDVIGEFSTVFRD
jgi:8-oxo-dGTP pyrophosphatase MutT (NUDIX family)/GTP-binding protein EngB required for normal cell division